MTSPVLQLAPIRGVTDCLFRTLFQHSFGGIDLAVAPFVNPQRYVSLRDKHLADLLPEANPLLPVIPQLLHTNAADFITLAHLLHELGYTRLNWNLGCPAPMVARKRRGSGLLPYPDAICALLDTICPAIPQSLSIKTRLGYASPDELATLLPRLDDYPLEEIIIHPRLGKQMYQGAADPDAFARCLPLTRHRLVYNGDITSAAQLAALRRRFPTINGWMIGRGLLAHPFLALECRGVVVDAAERLQRIAAFHDELYARYHERLSGPSHLLGRMKQLWFYLIHSFPAQERCWKKIKKAMNEQQYAQAVAELLTREGMRAAQPALAAGEITQSRFAIP
ncbi:MAG: tRNA-dihydrouridine synthase [Desulfobulbaceae bacterium A2]|nr:MAG: tRNA-dihydrouridine synthase [Desulfobulbaceae bacterium A2]